MPNGILSLTIHSSVSPELILHHRGNQSWRGQHPADSATSQLQHTCLEVSINLEDLVSFLQVSFKVGAELCSIVALQEQYWTPLIHHIKCAERMACLLEEIILSCSCH